MFLGILTFVAGVLVGYKFPRQVEQTVEGGKKLVIALKDKLTKKAAPPTA